MSESSRAVDIAVGAGHLAGELARPAGARGLVVFAHGSGSSRLSPRNRAVAAALRARGLATLLFDLLTPQEQAIDDRTREYRFDIPLLAGRLMAVLDWTAADPALAALPTGLFGASTGAAAALIAAAGRPGQVGAVVSRGGRTDLADTALGRVRAPVLFIVGGRDAQVLALNRASAARLQAPHALVVVPGASHLFPEPGALEQATDAAADWFARYLD